MDADTGRAVLIGWNGNKTGISSIENQRVPSSLAQRDGSGRVRSFACAINKTAITGQINDLLETMETSLFQFLPA